MLRMDRLSPPSPVARIKRRLGKVILRFVSFALASNYMLSGSLILSVKLFRVSVRRDMLQGRTWCKRVNGNA